MLRRSSEAEHRRFYTLCQALRSIYCPLRVYWAFAILPGKGVTGASLGGLSPLAPSYAVKEILAGSNVVL
jgi:hypothetical protein